MYNLVTIFWQNIAQSIVYQSVQPFCKEMFVIFRTFGFFGLFFHTQIIKFTNPYFSTLPDDILQFVTINPNVLYQKKPNDYEIVTIVTKLLIPYFSTVCGFFEKFFIFTRFSINFFRKNADKALFFNKKIFWQFSKTCKKSLFSINPVIFSTCEH